MGGRKREGSYMRMTKKEIRRREEYELDIWWVRCLEWNPLTFIFF
jgi:hypothetical protein